MLTHCPICKYDLTGLPDQHHCPECSFEFDRNSTLIQLEPPPSRRMRWTFAFLVLLLLFNIIVLWMKNSPFLWFMLFTQPLALLGIALAIRPGRPVALVRPGDVQIIKRRSLRAWYSLEKVARAEWSFVDGGVRLLDAQDLEVNCIPCGLRWSSTATKNLTAAINERLAAQANIRKPST